MDLELCDLDPRMGVAVVEQLRHLSDRLVLIAIGSSRVRGVSTQYAAPGVDAYLPRPLNVSELRQTLIELLRTRGHNWDQPAQREAAEDGGFQDFIGASEPMRLVYEAIRQVANSNITVLIRGESGTGKELVGRALVALSRRANKPFIRINCAALPENLIESELFGSEKGAFTGATESRPGQIELADQGTLFLDEIATLALPLQTKLLRVLEDRQVQRLGGRTLRKIDFRLVCATHEPLEELVAQGRFREDLFYRIHVVPIHLPPLRERADDISRLAEFFLRVHCEANGVPVKRLAEAASQVFREHRWPGNVRELENLIQRLVITVRPDEIGATHLPPGMMAGGLPVRRTELLPESGTDFDNEIESLEISLLTEALHRAKGSKSTAARLLRLDVQRLKYLCRKYSL
ncbi:sigma-54-dependent transcriptional regulator [Granulicella sibirica]|nr:sigma-54 dependent transcriptional regulator [Granulicella sibirica]